MSFLDEEEIDRSTSNYLRILIPIAIIVLLVIGLVVYFNLPRVGQNVKAPKGLAEAVYDHFLTQEKRTAIDMAFYYCDKYYWVAVETETKPIDPTKPIDLSQLKSSYRVIANDNSDGTWKISAIPIFSKESNTPCRL